MIKALYPGSFDPVTYGHMNIAARAARIFGHLTVAIYDRPIKSLAFTADQRVAMMEKALRHLPNVDVVRYGGLTVAYARKIGAQVIVRGLRASYDFEYEYQMALTNEQLEPDIDTVCLMTSLEYAFVSSTIVKEVFRAGGSVVGMVPDHVSEALRLKFPQAPMAPDEIEPASPR
jgi:pantetheine-phosphate adenylyltransferase